MKLGKVIIKDFRSITSTELILDSHITALVGGNESGKSNILLAINKFLNVEDFEETDKYQLSTTEPYISVEFTDFSEEELKTLKELTEVDPIHKIIVSRTGNTYKLEFPEIPIDSESTAPAEEAIKESPADVPPDTQEPEPVPSAPIDANYVIDEIKNKIPDANLINALGDLIRGKNIPLTDLALTYEDLEKEENRNKGYLITIKKLLELGGIQDSDITHADTSFRVDKLNRGAAKAGEKLRTAWTQEDIKMRMFADPTNLVIQFRDCRNIADSDKDNDAKWIWTWPEDRSFGFQWYVTFYSRYLSEIENSQNAIFLIDDIGLPLNKKAQKDLLNKFRELTRINPKIQIVYVTHSKDLVEWDSRNQILMVTKEKGKGTNVSSKWWTKYTQNELPAPLDEISLTWSEDLLGPKNLILEGPIDEKVFYKVTELLEEELSTNPFKDFKIIAAGGVHAANSLRHLSKLHGKKCYLVYDSDQTGLDEKNKAISESFSCEDLKSLSSSTTFNIVTIEDLLPRELYIAELNKIGKKVYATKWKEVSNLHGIPASGIIGAIKTRLGRDGLGEQEVKTFMDNYKYPLAIGVVNILTLEDYKDSNQLEAVKKLFKNLSTKLN